MTEVNPLIALADYIAHYPTNTAAAHALGISRAFLSQMLLTHSPIPVQILAKLGLRRIVVKVGTDRRRSRKA